MSAENFDQYLGPGWNAMMRPPKETIDSTFDREYTNPMKEESKFKSAAESAKKFVFNKINEIKDERKQAHKEQVQAKFEERLVGIHDAVYVPEEEVPTKKPTTVKEIFKASTEKAGVLYKNALRKTLPRRK